LETIISTAHSGIHPIPDVVPERRTQFRLSGQLLGRLSEQIFLFTLIWYLFTKTHSAFQVGLFLICSTLPAAIISPFNVMITRHYPRLNRLAAMNLFRCILVLIIAGSFYYHFVSIWLLNTAAVLLAVGGAIYNPIQTSILPNMLARNPETPGELEQLWLSMGALTGILAVGFFYHSSSIPYLLMVSAMVFMAAALLECWFAFIGPETGDGDFTEASSYQSMMSPPKLRSYLTSLHSRARGWKFLWITSLFLLVNLLFWPVLLIVIPYLVKLVFKLTSLEFGLVLGAYWAGVVIGVTVLTHDPSAERSGNISCKDFAGFGILTLLLALPLLTGLSVWSALIMDIILALLLGLISASANLRMAAFLESQSGDMGQNPIRAWFGAMMAITGSIGFLIAGWLTQFVPVFWLFTGGGVGIGLVLGAMAVLKTFCQNKSDRVR
jgi:hypothetical protein